MQGRNLMVAIDQNNNPKSYHKMSQLWKRNVIVRCVQLVSRKQRRNNQK